MPNVLQEEIDKTKNAITEREKLRGTLSDDEVDQLLAPLYEKLQTLNARLQTTTLGNQEIAVGGDVGGNIITGDNNQISLIIYHYYKEDETNQNEYKKASLQTQIAAYLRWLGGRCSTIALRGIKRGGEQVIQLPLDEVYVPLVAKLEQGWAKPDLPISLNEVLKRGKRLLIVGGPGSGKTTVLLHIAWTLVQAITANDLALAKEKIGLNMTPEEGLPLPIFIPLSAYASYFQDNPNECDLAAFITHYLKQQEATFNLPADFFRKLWSNKQNVLLLLDGLDEVPTENERKRVSRAVEKLVSGRENLRVLVTCRSAAYHGEAMLAQQFRQIKVLPLKEEDIEQMVRQAYQCLYKDDHSMQKAQADELLKGVARLEAERNRRLGKDAKRLIDSPLLVRMLLIVHFSDRRLPGQRSELYAKAVEAMLLPTHNTDVDEEVVQEIGQRVGGDWQTHREVVQQLAFGMHQRGKELGREINEEVLKQILNQSPTCSPYINSFISLTRQRGTVMEEISSNYRFIHLSFQEFLVARYLAEVIGRENGVQGIINFLCKGLITDSWWREPALLVAGYLSENSPQTAQKFIQGLQKCENLPDVRLAAAEIAGTAVLEWRTPQPDLQREIVQRIIALLEDPRIKESTAYWRATIGDVLGQFGDPRPGVGVRTEDKLPDIAWGTVIPTGNYTIYNDSYNHRQERRILHPYQLARYPITNAQFNCFVQANDVANPRWWKGMPENETDFNDPKWPITNRPRENVSWYQAIAFSRWLTHHFRKAQVIQPKETITLPDEYQWKVAALYAGNGQAGQRNYPWGNAKITSEHANYHETKLEQTSAVGIFPNGRQSQSDLDDLSGNVWEWCIVNSDTYPGKAKVAQNTNPNVLLCGGSWYDISDNCMTKSINNDISPSFRGYHIGFRLVRTF